MEDARPSSGGDEIGSIGDLLRNTRLARNLTLQDIEARTKIGRQLLQRLERNELAFRPSERFYKEQSLRAYASAVGLDPRAVVERFRREFPVVDPVPAVVPPVPSRQLWLTVSAICAAAFIVGFGIAHRPSAAPEPEAHVVQNASPRSEEMNVKGPAVADVLPSAPGLSIPLPPAPAPLVPQPPVTPAAPPLAEAPPSPGHDIEGELMIASTPPGARITVNGVARGTTPATVQFLPPGSYTIRIIHPGYQIAQRRVTLTAQRPIASVSVELERPVTEVPKDF